MSVLVVGSSNRDIFVYTEKIPTKGETILGKGLSYKFGGKGANQAIALARMNSTVSFLTCVGNDDFGLEIINNLKKEKVDISKIKISNNLKTGTAIISLDSNADNTIIVIKGANDGCDIDYIRKNEKLFAINEYILLQMEIPVDSIEESIFLAKKYNKKVILNPAPAKIIDKDLYNKIDYLTPNESELELLAFGNIKNRDLDTCAKKVLDLGIKNLIITLGSKGVIYYKDDEKKQFSAVKVDAIDTVGAGDCFNGAFVSALDKGMNIEDSIKFANLASSIAVTRSGAQESIPRLDEVMELLKKV